ncbi:probable chitinase 2 [Ischnura elegans]|uniref:probable chitinase 2 n=1 Tax=Ischnura elegans TaxID=197161 RepID=UPI001ED8BC49|nr:probable chitinase 2 [Ischnura elegans]
MITKDLISLGLLLVVATCVGSQRQPGGVAGLGSGIREARVTKHGKAVVCYVASWAVYRPERGSFSIEELEPALDGCTHVVYAFAGLNSTTNGLRSLDPFRDLEENYGKGTYRRMTGLRRHYPHLKVTLAVGGWNEGSQNYSAMAATANTRALFVASALDFIHNYDFDGLDLDWEYPSQRGGKPEDKKNFVALVRELKEAFKSRGWILTSAFGAAKDKIDAAYDVQALAPHIDLFHLMCYDYHGSWDQKTGHNAPLHPPEQPRIPLDEYFNVEYTVKHMLRLGAPPEKLVLGVPMYGRTFLLANEDDGKVGSPAKPTGFQGRFTKEDGFMGYNELCLEFMPPKDDHSDGHDHDNHNMSLTWRKSYDEVAKTPYAVKGDHWLSYDDEASIKEKVKFAMSNGLGGIMIWSIDTDDFHGDCSGENSSPSKKFPLLNAINDAIEESMNETPNEIPDGKEEEDSGSISLVSSSVFVILVNLFLVKFIYQ